MKDSLLPLLNCCIDPNDEGAVRNKGYLLSALFYPRILGTKPAARFAAQFVRSEDEDIAAMSLDTLGCIGGDFAKRTLLGELPRNRGKLDCVVVNALNHVAVRSQLDIPLLVAIALDESYSDRARVDAIDGLSARTSPSGKAAILRFGPELRSLLETKDENLLSSLNELFEILDRPARIKRS